MVSTRRYAGGLAELDRRRSAAGRDPEALHRVVVLFAHVDEDGERARTEALDAPLAPVRDAASSATTSNGSAS